MTKKYFDTEEERDTFNTQEAIERRYFGDGVKWYPEKNDLGEEIENGKYFVVLTSKSWQEGQSNRIYFNSETERGTFNAALAEENNADPNIPYYPYGQDDISWYIKTPDGTTWEKIKDWITGN